MAAPSSSGGGAPLQAAVAKFVVDLHPSKSGSLLEGVREYLSAMLLRWSDDFEGVVLGYRKERITSRQASVCYWHPMVRVDAAAELVLFKPKPGHVLVGTVNKIGRDYLGLLAMGVFNVSIAREDIRSDLHCSQEGDCWVSGSNSAHQVFEGTAVRFVVTGVEREGFVTMTGALQQRWTGDVEVVGPAPGPAAPPAAAAVDTAGVHTGEQREKKKEKQVGGALGVQGGAVSKKKKKSKRDKGERDKGERDKGRKEKGGKKRNGRGSS